MPFPIAFAYPWYLVCLLALAPVVWLWWQGRNPLRPWREAISLSLRVAILVLLVLGLAGLQWVRASDELAVVFLLDVSDSIDAAAREQAISFMRAALEAMGEDDRAALVLFGADALVERPMSQARELGELLSIPATAHTDVGKAVRLGLALLPATAQRRLVLLSDGQANVAGAETAARLAMTGGVRLYTVLLPARSGDEAWLDGVDVPGVLYEGETFSVLVRVRSLVSQPARVRLFADGALVAEEAVLLHPGLNTFLFDLSAGAPGFSTFTAQLVPRDDVFYQNNALGAFSLVKGAPRVLVVARPPYEDQDSGLMVDDAERLALALGRAGLHVERSTVGYMPADLASLGEYASLVLVNVPAPALSLRQMDLLQAYVRDLGRGLVCVGGEESYGVGGYYKTALEETLPVDMTIKDRERVPPLAIVFAIDKSGSMDIAAAQGGVRKIELAKEAILRSLELLTPGDRVGVVAFESTAKWVWPLSELADVAAVQEQVSTLRASGGTDIYAGLSASVTALEGIDAQLKHVILLTDGGASQEGLGDLAMRLRAANGTLSTVGVGQDTAPFLQSLALDGGGRYHFTDSPASIPQIFVQETMLAQRAYIVEETFYPLLAGRSAIVEGIPAVPALHGYVATSTKPAAQMILASAQDDPILAQWQYGLGRAVAWTSDAKGKWARAWVQWEQFPRFWAQAVRWTILERDESGLEAQIVDQGDRASVTVDVVVEEGGYGDALDVEAHLISPSLERETVRLQQTAPGRYEGAFRPDEEGVYLVRIVASPRSGVDAPALTDVTGFVRSYSPEYRTFGTDETMLHRLAEAGNGTALDDPAQAFARAEDQEVVRTYTDVWPWLLGIAVCALPFDVGVRRVIVNLRDVRRAVTKRLSRLRRPSPETARSEQMSRLLSAKGRAPVQPDARVDVPEIVSLSPEAGPAADGVSSEGQAPVTEAPPSSPSPVHPEAEETAPSAESSMTSRLLAAKRRAQEREEPPD
jgi:Mg-chelatase subunit ChlD